MNVLLVAIGGFLGAVARFWISTAWKARYRGTFPFATLLINTGGSFLLGWLWGANVGADVMLLCGTGFLGAFTTFSTFTLETVQLQKKLSAVLYLFLTYSLGICCAYAGYIIARGTL